MKHYISLDVGGSKILGGLFDEKGEILNRIKVKTFASKGTKFVFNQICLVIDELKRSLSKLDGITVIVPGIVLGDDIVEFCPNVPFVNYDLGPKLREKYSVPVKLGNDVSVALYGEWRHLEDGMDNAVGIFMGTGVGGGLIINDKLYYGKGGAGEIGHMVVQPDGKECGCHNYGCLEAYASKSGMMKSILSEKERGRASKLYDHLKDDGSMIKSSAFEECVEQGDELTLELVDRAAYYMGLAVASLANLFHPDIFIFGGGLAENLGHYLLPNIERIAKDHAMPAIATDINLQMSVLGDDAGIIGGFHLIREEVENDA